MSHDILLAQQNKRLGGFISLKWKVLVLSSLLLIGITATISSLNYFNLLSLYKAQRDTVIEKSTLQIVGLLARSGQNLQTMGSMISNMSGVQNAFQDGDMVALDDAISKRWISLKIDSGIEILQFYGLDSQPLISRNINERTMLEALLWVSRVNISEQPVTFIECAEICLQVSIIPILLQGEHVGALLLARSLADIVLDLNNIAGSDAGVMIGAESDGGDPARYIEVWGYRVIALTHWSDSMNTIKKAASMKSLPDQLDESIDIEYKGKHFEIRSYSLGDHNNNAVFLIIDDVTTEKNIITRDNNRNIMTSVVGLVVAEMLLLALLWLPMSRLRVTALTLPLLSQRKYEMAKNSVKMNRSRFHVDDESDVLIDTTINLSEQLAVYHAESQMNLQTLASRADEIETQKDFVTSLIHTANAIIMTQDDHSEILSINDYGRELLGITSDELIGVPFTSILVQEGLSVELYRDVSDLNAGRLTKLSHILCVLGKDQLMHHISWHHSRIPNVNGQNTTILTVGHDITERINAEQRLSWSAEHDSLTGMHNRRGFQTYIDIAIEEAVKNNVTGAMLFMDLDQFKDVNDSSGHQAGDLLLKEVATCLTDVVPSDGFSARIGGDEFGIILSDVDEEDVVALAKKIQHRLEKVTLPIKDRIHSISSSIGIAMFPEHGENSSDVFACADLAMYQAKGKGRGCWYVYSRNEQIRERLNERLYWKDTLEKALELDQFTLYFQPIVNIKTGKASHFECLLRHIDEEGVITAPGLLIEIAESCGLIHAIDRMVVCKAIAQLKALQARGMDINFAVNLSAHAFSDPGLFELLEKLICDSGLDPSRLIFEVTETAAITDFAVAQAYITSIKALGCRFALDDFGVGFASFYSLKKLPVDFVKIDGSFIKDLDTNRDDQVLVRSLSQVAQGFGKKTVAEFVENEQTLDILRQYGIDYAQGYLLSRPMPAKEIFQKELPLFF